MRLKASQGTAESLARNQSHLSFSVIEDASHKDLSGSRQDSWRKGRAVTIQREFVIHSFAFTKQDDVTGGLLESKKASRFTYFDVWASQLRATEQKLRLYCCGIPQQNKFDGQTGLDCDIDMSSR
ncbi:hypothetical protein SUGI_1073310 [Cryptomeria japonica]|nr:hypothetical protein SUGI_1073310 [Cryptomeria japonica]